MAYRLLRDGLAIGSSAMTSAAIDNSGTPATGNDVLEHLGRVTKAHGRFSLASVQSD